MLVKNVTMLGHKDHGKSTLIGSILMLTNSVSKARIEEAKRYSKRLGRPFEPAFILDSFEEEREGGLTIDTTRAEASYKGVAFELIDVPGHEELIKNMMSGASFAETAILVVSAKQEEGIREQTKRHVFIARMLGIESLLVAVNKMDSANYSKKVYEGIVDEIKKFFAGIGFTGKVRFVPISAYNGDNIISRSKKMSWYKGKPLLEELYALTRSKSKDGMKDLRAVVQGFIEESNRRLVGAKVLSGVLKRGKVTFLPGNIKRNILKLVVKGKSVGSAKSGESVAIELDKPLEEPRGLVISSGCKPIVSNKVHALLFSTMRLGPDSKITLRLLGKDVEVKKVSILSIIDASSGASKKGKAIAPLDAGHAELLLGSDVAVEKYSNLKSMGRFTFYKGSKFGGVGIIE
ncbi:MAG: GTP-binding protein [Candidatus Micrarchaeia archaeon]